MTQTITTIDLIRRSMMLINAIAAGEIPSDADLNDALLTFNEMIDSMKLQPLVGYGEPNENFTLFPGKSVYQWGFLANPITHDFVSERPVWVNNATCIRQGISTPVMIISQDEYDAIPVKNTPSGVVDRLLYVPDFPEGVVTVYPVPTEAVTLSINAARQIQGPATLQTTIVLPPGYLRMYRYNLAVELWPEYANTTTDINAIRAIARESLGKIKVANSDIPTARFDDVPGVDGQDWDWRVV